ncbi:MAG: hypothetical protein WCI22_15285, partial [Actinomycetota bacterium]
PERSRAQWIRTWRPWAALGVLAVAAVVVIQLVQGDTQTPLSSTPPTESWSQHDISELNVWGRLHEPQVLRYLGTIDKFRREAVTQEQCRAWLPTIEAETNSLLQDYTPAEWLHYTNSIHSAATACAEGDHLEAVRQFIDADYVFRIILAAN